MMKALLSLLLLAGAACGAAEVDQKLSRVIATYDIQPCHNGLKGDFADFGKKLFDSKALSGSRDTSCSTCHIENLGFADGLPLAIGVGGEGEGSERLAHGRGAIVPRNAFTLNGRGRDGFKTFFWDGKVDSFDGNLFTPFGDDLSPGFSGPLSVAAVLPLTERDEFLGLTGLGYENDLRRAVGDSLYQARFEALDEALVKRVIEDDQLRDAMLDAGLLELDVNLVFVANALAEFIKSKFSCVESNWEQYLRGDSTALSEVQKRGATLFFGKGRCAGCHSPPLFSDFRYYNLGIPQGEFGPHSRGRDLGRAGVTNLRVDRYLFRTPPLISVSHTSPYGHNGRYSSLRSIVDQHINPVLPVLRGDIEITEKDEFSLGKIVSLISDELSYIEITSEAEIEALLEFLNAL
ncbi:His-Xaa-Ser system-associated MauG-like protein [Luminiphilus sp.]|nr:His-Xaa-Ser system-associated MauG-like protein [Luminiphilus sp.]